MTNYKASHHTYHPSHRADVRAYKQHHFSIHSAQETTKLIIKLMGSFLAEANIHYSVVGVIWNINYLCILIDHRTYMKNTNKIYKYNLLESLL